MNKEFKLGDWMAGQGASDIDKGLKNEGEQYEAWTKRGDRKI